MMRHHIQSPALQCDTCEAGFFFYIFSNIVKWFFMHYDTLFSHFSNTLYILTHKLLENKTIWANFVNDKSSTQKHNQFNDMKLKLTSMTIALSSMLCMPINAQNTPTSQMEKLGRGLTIMPISSTKELVSWRFLGTDSENTTFDLYRNGVLMQADIATATCCTLSSGTSTSKYQLVTKVNGEPVDTTAETKRWSGYYYTLKLERPADGDGYTYSPGDCSVGDVDGDGEYEIFVKWDPSNQKDNSQEGKTGLVYLDCYKVDWTKGGAGATPQKLWRINLGMNIRAGAHYTQYMVYDFDKDGKAEMICKTAPGSRDGQGKYVSEAATNTNIKNVDNTKDWRNSGGRIDGGYEFLTVFKGLTGEAVHTVFYKPNRNATTAGSTASGSFNWDDRSGKSDYSSYGNRGERYLAGVAYLDGPDALPCGIFVRGYYTYAYVWAVTFDGKELKDKLFHASDTKTTYKVTDANGKTTTYTAKKATRGSGSNTLYGNGNHNMSVGDVDGDGCDEIVWGSSCMDHDGKVLYATGYGHGDALHLADHNPDRPGLEMFEIHEGSPYGWDLHDAATGEILLSATGSKDNGRGIAGSFDPNTRGSIFSSSNDGSQRSAVDGHVVSTGTTSMNFRIYWNGDLYEEFLDGGKVSRWNGNGTTALTINGKNLIDYNASSTCNGSKSTPCLQADIFGDWREEVIMWSKNDNATLNVFTTPLETKYRVPTLMHDHTYRMGVAWQNTAYNQPPHIGYYLPDLFDPAITGIEKSVTKTTNGTQKVYNLQGIYVTSVNSLGDICKLPKGTYIVNGEKITVH